MYNCYGCGGKGWVSPSYGVAVKCPVCEGTGVVENGKPNVPDAPITPYTPPSTWLSPTDATRTPCYPPSQPTTYPWWFGPGLGPYLPWTVTCSGSTMCKQQPDLMPWNASGGNDDTEQD